MKHNRVAVQAVPRRILCSIALLTALGASFGCKSGHRTVAVQSYPMGERVQVGKVVFTITEAEWKVQLGEGAAIRVPKHRFLIVRLTATNSGASEASMPLLAVYNNKGETYRELDNGEQVAGWLGLIRTLQPSQTYSGAILFDVPPSSYKLQVTDGGEPGSEIIAYVDIPLQLETDPTLVTTPKITPK